MNADNLSEAGKFLKKWFVNGDLKMNRSLQDETNID